MKSSIAVLCSGGLDSAVLLAWAAARHLRVFPVFIRAGLPWEQAELRALRRFLFRAQLSGVSAPEALSLDCRDLYTARWTKPGGRAPGRRAASNSVYLPGRNLLLLSKAAVYAAERRIDRLAMGLLRGNPFADSTPAFLRSFERAASRALSRRLRVLAPFRSRTKAQVIRLGRSLPLRETLSCIAPKGGLHCGRCTKCFERRQGFRGTDVLDTTVYCR